MRKEAKIKDSIKGFHWWLGALLLLLSACVTDYEPKGLEQVRDLLVVDGIITNGETTIKLRRSVGLTDDFTEDEFVNNAKVVVEREDGAVSLALILPGRESIRWIWESWTRVAGTGYISRWMGWSMSRTIWDRR